MINEVQYLPKVITIDGPSGAGKSILCKAIAKKLQWNFLDSGAIYRSLALIALRYRIDLTAEETLASLAKYLNICFASGGVENVVNSKILLEGEVINSKICTQKIAMVASRIAILPRVRKELLQQQRTFRRSPGLVAVGRDMGTTVFDDAEVKIFLDASPETRVIRRMLQMKKKGFKVNFKRLLSEIKERDNRDRNRSISPLVPAKDAFLLDSTSLTIEQLIEKALQCIRQKLMV